MQFLNRGVANSPHAIHFSNCPRAIYPWYIGVYRCRNCTPKPCVNFCAKTIWLISRNGEFIFRLQSSENSCVHWHNIHISCRKDGIGEITYGSRGSRILKITSYGCEIRVFEWGVRRRCLCETTTGIHQGGRRTQGFEATQGIVRAPTGASSVKHQAWSYIKVSQIREEPTGTCYI
jgi:hypothetical protein